MPRLNVIRAWKDVAYRLSLSAAEQALLPDNPAGAIELTETELDGVLGGMPDTCNGCTVDRCGWDTQGNSCILYMSCGTVC
jgi:mersacidin/lichenicidin family type 2 lantibiotic